MKLALRSPRDRDRAPRRQSGFTLIELIVVVAILAVLAGSALPIAGRAWNSAARRATRTRLEILARASVEFCRDCGRPPRSVAELFERPDGARGWMGPYVAIEELDFSAGRGASDAAVRPGARDAWSRTIEVEPEPHFVLRSAGADLASFEDDLAVSVDFTPVRRELTLQRLDDLNSTIASWRRAHPDAELPHDWPAARRTLVESGMLRASSETELDAFGRPFAADPDTLGGLTRLVSTGWVELGRRAR